MPPFSAVAGAWTLDWAALALILAAAVLYGRGLAAARRRGVHWPVWRAAAFYLLGLGSFALLSFGFPGVYGPSLRWAFTLKITGYVFVVPLLAGLGLPLTLARAALAGEGRQRLERFVGSRAVRLASNSIVAPLLGMALFAAFLTPFFLTLRTSPAAEEALALLAPAMGMLMVIPIIEEDHPGRTSAVAVVEFIYVFIELLIDSVPGIVLRIAPGVLDGATSMPAALQPWFPNPLRDQQLAGDLLWFIAEIVDIPLIVLMFVRFARNDRRDAHRFDALTDEELDDLNRQHLRGPRPHAG
jgi:cytochrome c oxidase assembly factor CtaG